MEDHFLFIFLSSATILGIGMYAAYAFGRKQANHDAKKIATASFARGRLQGISAGYDVGIIHGAYTALHEVKLRDVGLEDNETINSIMADLDLDIAALTKQGVRPPLSWSPPTIEKYEENTTNDKTE
jgi:hypothetical protein